MAKHTLSKEYNFAKSMISILTLYATKVIEKMNKKLNIKTIMIYIIIPESQFVPSGNHIVDNPISVP